MFLKIFFKFHSTFRNFIKSVVVRLGFYFKWKTLLLNLKNCFLFELLNLANLQTLQNPLKLC